MDIDLPLSDQLRSLRISTPKVHCAIGISKSESDIDK